MKRRERAVCYQYSRVGASARIGRHRAETGDSGQLASAGRIGTQAAIPSGRCADGSYSGHRMRPRDGKKRPLCGGGIESCVPSSCAAAFSGGLCSVSCFLPSWAVRCRPSCRGHSRALRRSRRRATPRRVRLRVWRSLSRRRRRMTTRSRPAGVASCARSTPEHAPFHMRDVARGLSVLAWRPTSTTEGRGCDGMYVISGFGDDDRLTTAVLIG